MKQGTAIFSTDPEQQYRYVLTREIQLGLEALISASYPHYGDHDEYPATPPGPRTVLFICLNPSTATATANDQTVSKMERYARRWGYPRLVVCNAFALRSRDPKALHRHPAPVGPDNNRHIEEQARAADLIVLAWGNHAFSPVGLPGAQQSASRHLELLLLLGKCEVGDKVCSLGLTKIGAPKHPLYLRGDLEPVPWR